MLINKVKNSLSGGWVVVWRFLVFSVMAIFVLIFITKNADIPDRQIDEILNSPHIYLAVIFVSNLIGFGLFWIASKFWKPDHTLFVKKQPLIWHFFFSCILMFGLDYLLLVSTKFIARLDHPFSMTPLEIAALLSLWLVEMVSLGQMQVNTFYRKLIDLYEKTSELEESALRAKYNALQSQLNPHFLFNSLNTLMSEIEYDPQNAVRFTENLSNVYRYILHFQDQMTVSLRSEFEFLQPYLYLYEVRLGNCLELDKRVPEEYMNRLIPPLTLQLLVENIIKHNVFYEEKPMTFTISTDRKGDYLTVSNPIRQKKDVTSTGKGLRNLAQRYELLAGREIFITRDNGIFTVRVPLLMESKS